MKGPLQLGYCFIHHIKPASHGSKVESRNSVCMAIKGLFIGSDIEHRGAGIGGLMLASCIAQVDKRKEIEVDIYEGATELAEIGAGINIWPRGFEMLAKVGLKEDILEVCEGATAHSCSFPLADVR